MLSRIEKLYTKDEMQNILSSFAQEKNVCVFANTLKTSIEELEKEFLKQNLNLKRSMFIVICLMPKIRLS